ncbi:inositol 2-dehydrogenase-like [Bacillus rossius redtenbacheri]|uniref:inositol 2-dehydrogenase-like n=1 Tax=Bacillus rossius redtenbacheri TaxID=93214 RepID=UPI002FDD1860
MATLKFKDPSPYKLPPPQPHSSDYVFEEYNKDLFLKTDSRGLQKPVNVALFGLGRAGTLHLRNLSFNPRAKILYIVDDIEERMHSCKKYWRLEGAQCIKMSEADKVFNDPELDAVVISTPTFTHEKITRRALAKGKFVFCEKPVAQDLETAKRCYEEARRVGKPLFTAFNRRFDPSYSNVRERVHSGEVGHVQIVKITSKDCMLAPIEYMKTSGGIFTDSLVHDIDMMCWMVGEFPNRVAAMGSANVPEVGALDDFDTVAVLAHFPSGTIGIINLTRNSDFGYDQRLEVFGSRGMVAAGNERPMAGVTVQRGLSGEVRHPIYFTFASRYKEAYQREMEHFLDVVQGKESELKVKDYETMAVSKIAAACEKSAKTGTFVNISWGDDEIPKN